MNNITKRKIGRAVSKAHRRRRMSEAMKESWRRRRARTNGTVDLSPEPTRLIHVYTDDDLLKVAITLIGRENVRSLLSDAIKGALV